MGIDFTTAIANVLTEAEASARLARYGQNDLPSKRRHGVLSTAWGVVREPMFLLLLACGGVYLTLGDVREATMLLGFVFVVLGITLVQERKTERALEALRDLSSPRALVVRDRLQRRIAGRDVVPGDILVLTEGDRVPADAVALSFTTLVMANLGLIVANRSRSRVSLMSGSPATPALRGVLAGTVTGLGLVLYVPPIRDAFHFSTLHPFDLAICGGAGMLALLWFEAMKWIGACGRRRSGPGPFPPLLI